MLATTTTIQMSEALVGLPVAVVIVFLSLGAWRLLANGKVVLGREHEGLKADRDFWRSTALRVLNIGEAVVGREPRGPFDDIGGPDVGGQQ